MKVAVWCSGIIVARINEVTLHRAQLVRVGVRMPNKKGCPECQNAESMVCDSLYDSCRWPAPNVLQDNHLWAAFNESPTHIMHRFHSNCCLSLCILYTVLRNFDVFCGCVVLSFRISIFTVVFYCVTAYWYCRIWMLYYMKCVLSVWSHSIHWYFVGLDSASGLLAFRPLHIRQNRHSTFRRIGIPAKISFSIPVFRHSGLHPLVLGWVRVPGLANHLGV